MPNKPTKKTDKFTSDKKNVVSKKQTINSVPKTNNLVKKTLKRKKPLKLSVVSLIIIFLVVLGVSIWYLFPLKVYFVYVDESLLEYDTEENVISKQYFDYYANLKYGESIGENFPLIDEFFDDTIGFSIRFFDESGKEFTKESKAYIDFKEDLDLYAYVYEINPATNNNLVVYPPSTILEYPEYSGAYYDKLDFENITIATLRQLINDSFVKTSYDAAGKGGLLIEADTPYGKNEVFGIYDSTLFERNWLSGKNFEREHVWCNSRLGMPRVTSSGKNQASDLHNLRAIGGVYSTKINQKRSDRYFVDGMGEVGYIVGTNGFYPGDSFKGDVARILLYMVVMYDFLKLTSDISKLDNYTPYTLDGALMGDLSLLLKWNLEDPVDAFEIHRNDVIYNYQRNRNPFIDHPELVSIINFGL